MEKSAYGHADFCKSPLAGSGLLQKSGRWSTDFSKSPLVAAIWFLRTKMAVFAALNARDVERMRGILTASRELINTKDEKVCVLVFDCFFFSHIH